MNLPPLPLIDGCLFIDNSSWVEGMSTCYRYLEYKSLHLRIGAAEKPSLNFGSAIHTGVELRHVRYGTGPIDEAYYNDLSAILTDFYEGHPVPLDDWRTLNWAMSVMRRYNERYAKEEFSLLRYDTPIPCPHCEGKVYKLLNNVPDPSLVCPWCLGTGKREMMVEMSFALPLFTYRGPIVSELEPSKLLESIPVFYTGRIDLPVFLDNQIYVMDHKTTGQLGQTFFDGKRLSSQQRGYAWAFEQLTGKRVAGYIVNAIRTKEPPQYVLDGKPSARGKSLTPAQWWLESLQRERYEVSPEALVEWKNNTIDLVEEFFWHYRRGYLPMKTEWCVRYGLCPYFDVCRLGEEDRGVMLHSALYTNNTWTPMKQPTQSKQ